MSNTVSPTSIKWDIKTLEQAYSQETLKLLFPEELAFVQKNVWRFLQNMPQVITSINSNTLGLGSLMTIRGLMNTEIENERLAKEQAEKDRKYDEEMAARKAAVLPHPSSLTSGHWR